MIVGAPGTNSLHTPSSLLILSLLQVPGLQDPYENRVGTSGKTKTISSTAIASNQAMMERLFGPDEKTRLRTVLARIACR